MQIALISITATRRVLATTMTSNPSDSDDRIMELTSEGDESKLDDICVRDASCARLFPTNTIFCRFTDTDTISERLNDDIDSFYINRFNHY